MIDALMVGKEIKYCRTYKYENNVSIENTIDNVFKTK
jgi:hypothetical protein